MSGAVNIAARGREVASRMAQSRKKEREASWMASCTDRAGQGEGCEHRRKILGLLVNYDVGSFLNKCCNDSESFCRNSGHILDSKLETYFS